MIEWFKSMIWYEKLLWIISIVSTLLFFYQLILTVAKRSPDRTRKHIFSRFFSFKNIVAFLSMFGWTSIAGIYQNMPVGLSLAFGILSGLILMSVMSVLFYFVHTLKEIGNPDRN
ncbi:MAG: hypothetical protein H3C39_06395 [Flavobacteriia bacterium]|nr:hypothetical protein [Flavobacteriia bacterium]